MMPLYDQIITPGMELAAVSQVVDKLDFAIDGSSTSISRQDLNRIVDGPSTDKHLKYIVELKYLAGITQPLLENEIAQHDVEEKCTFDGGFNELVRWYRSVT
eukprot:8947149-Ditylum_brightwellii.AAC.1